VLIYFYSMKNFIRQFGFIVFGVLMLPAIANAASFPDVGSDHSNYDAVEYLKENNGFFIH